MENYEVFISDNRVKQDKEKHINLGSLLTIDQILSLKIKIDKEFKDSDVLFLDSSEIRSIDLTGIQLLQHYISKAQIDNKVIHMDLTITSEQRIMLEKNGFSKLLETVFT
jgi:ABC-type transporter Mla MlaB component